MEDQIEIMLGDLKKLDPETWTAFRGYSNEFTRADEQWYDLLIGRIRCAVSTHITLFHRIDLIKAQRLGIRQWTYRTKYGSSGLEVTILIDGSNLIKDSGSPAKAWLSCYLKALRACKLCQQQIGE